MLYRPMVLAWCHHQGLDEHQSHDVAQEVFRSMLRALPQFQPSGKSGSFRAWLWTVTRSRIIDYFRSEARNPQGAGGSTAVLQLLQLAEASHELSESMASSEEPISPGQERQLMHRALEMVRVEFRDLTWRAFWRSAIEGMETSIVARELDMSEASVRQARSRVLRRVRTVLGDVGFE